MVCSMMLQLKLSEHWSSDTWAFCVGFLSGSIVQVVDQGPAIKFTTMKGGSSAGSPRKRSLAQGCLLAHLTNGIIGTFFRIKGGEADRT